MHVRAMKHSLVLLYRAASTQTQADRDIHRDTKRDRQTHREKYTSAE